MNVLRARCFARVLLAALCVLMQSFAVAQSLPSNVRAAFQRAAIPLDAVGIQVQEVGAHKPLLALNPSQPFNPASTMKLVTSTAALELLGPTFTWKTQVYTTGMQSGDILLGDLVIKGGGDPKLVLENFWLLLRQVRARGIRDIRGNVVLDRSFFEDSTYDPAKFDGDPLRPYNAGPDALLLNYKAFTFRFLPDAQSNTVKVATDPPVTGYAVTAPKLGGGDCGDWKQKLALRIDGNGAEFSGAYPAACGEKIWHVHPWMMPRTRYFGLVFRHLWQELGGNLRGEAVDGSVPADARLLLQWESPTLPEVVRDMNKYSNNVMARQMFLTLAAQTAQQPGNIERGRQAVMSWLASKKIDAPDLVIENGSGLSRTERIAPATMARLLATFYQSPLMPEFMSSLPLAGYDGTMRKRVQQQGVAGNAHIKTGSLNEVRAIAGYVLAASGKRYAVVCFINHGNAPRGQEAQDALLQWVYENG
ncbi:MAG: D-alanyl-D-alanine carboxypeptidase/D-alanyl-D-alanine-endopeptidase [Proteobacteria bacterium]|nr:D-alanyl-D-alanine carboxypeptidase/D-alanyl-D-alanine-endopeptidase [Pseudomonadota bacterium]